MVTVTVQDILYDPDDDPIRSKHIAIKKTKVTVFLIKIIVLDYYLYIIKALTTFYSEEIHKEP
jgi:hypothetical protein